MKRLFKKLLNSFGIDICKYLPPEELKNIEELKLLKSNEWLINYNIKQIIDIGANEGQFALKMRKIFPKAEIISFEPLTIPYKILLDNFKDDKKFYGYNLGLGVKKDEVEINVNQYSPSSSILPMLEVHKLNFPYTKNTTRTNIKIDTLNNVLRQRDLEYPLLIKIDVQGFEDKVILGGVDIIGKAKIIIIELSYTKLYKDQPLFDDIYYILKDLGFNFKGNYEQLYSPKDNAILQSDGIFIKN